MLLIEGIATATERGNAVPFLAFVALLSIPLAVGLPFQERGLMVILAFHRMWHYIARMQFDRWSMRCDNRRRYLWYVSTSENYHLFLQSFVHPPPPSSIRGLFSLCVTAVVC